MDVIHSRSLFLGSYLLMGGTCYKYTIKWDGYFGTILSTQLWGWRSWGAPLIHQSYLYGASLLVPVFIANGCIVFERDLSYTPMRASLSLSLQFAFLFNWYWYWWLCPKAFLCPSDHPKLITFSNVVVSEFLRQFHIIVNQKYRVIVYRLKYILWHTKIS